MERLNHDDAKEIDETNKFAISLVNGEFRLNERTLEQHFATTSTEVDFARFFFFFLLTDVTFERVTFETMFSTKCDLDESLPFSRRDQG